MSTESEDVTISADLLWNLIRCAEARWDQVVRERGEKNATHYERIVSEARDAMEAAYKKSKIL